MPIPNLPSYSQKIAVAKGESSMANPFSFYNDLWSAHPRGRPVERAKMNDYYPVDPWSPYCRPVERKSESPFVFSTEPWNATPRRQRPAPASAKGPPTVSISIEVNNVTRTAAPQVPDEVKSAAAVTIQRMRRGHQVRENMKVVSMVAAEVGEIEQKIYAQQRLGKDTKEQLRLNEELMAQLLRLDAVHGVRDYRKKVIRKVIALQDFMDSISAEPPKSPLSMNSAVAFPNSDGAPEETGPKKSVDATAADSNCDQPAFVESLDHGSTAIEVVFSEEGSKGSSITSIDGAEASESGPGSGAFDVGSKKLDIKDECKEDEKPDLDVEDEEFVLLSMEDLTCNSLTKAESEKASALYSLEHVTGETTSSQEEDTKISTVTMPDEAAPQMAKQSTQAASKPSTEASGMEELLGKVIAENERLKGLVAALHERSVQQGTLMGELADRIKNLEQAVQRKDMQ